MKPGLSEEAQKEAERELDRLSKLSVASAEYGVIRTYLGLAGQYALETSAQRITSTSAHARQVLEEDHYGFKGHQRAYSGNSWQSVNFEQSVLMNLNPIAMTKKNTMFGVTARVRFLCFVGPPGVGKTSLGGEHCAGHGA